MDTRPNLNAQISVKDFREFYWLKEELIQFCTEANLKTTGGKIEIAERIEHYLRTGKKVKPVSKAKDKSHFDWSNEKLTLEAVITENYKNTENVRKFFVELIGKRFKFNVKFMNWMKSNPGKTLEQAATEWLRIEHEKRTRSKPKEIAPQFEYNRFLRDFLADNPTKSRDLGIELWKKKKSMRGDNIYRKEDLEFL